MRKLVIAVSTVVTALMASLIAAAPAGATPPSAVSGTEALTGTTVRVRDLIMVTPGRHGVVPGNGAIGRVLGARGAIVTRRGRMRGRRRSWGWRQGASGGGLRAR